MMKAASSFRNNTAFNQAGGGASLRLRGNPTWRSSGCPPCYGREYVTVSHPRDLPIGLAEKDVK